MPDNGSNSVKVASKQPADSQSSDPGSALETEKGTTGPDRFANLNDQSEMSPGWSTPSFPEVVICPTSRRLALLISVRLTVYVIGTASTDKAANNKHSDARQFNFVMVTGSGPYDFEFFSRQMRALTRGAHSKSQQQET